MMMNLMMKKNDRQHLDILDESISVFDRMNKNLDCVFEKQDRRMYLDVIQHFSNVSFVFVDENVDDLEDCLVLSVVLLESIVQQIVVMDDNDMHWKQKVLARKKRTHLSIFSFD